MNVIVLSPVAYVMSNLSAKSVSFNALIIAFASASSSAPAVNLTVVVEALPSLSITVTAYVDSVPSAVFVSAADTDLPVVAGSVVSIASALLLTEACTLLPDCEPSSNFIVLNSVVSEILVSSL